MFLKDDGKKLLRSELSQISPEEYVDCKMLLRTAGSGRQPSSPGHVGAGLWQTTDVQSKFTSPSTARTVTLRFQQHCRDTLLLVLM